MKLLIQRVKMAEVTVKQECVGKIGKGLLILLGISKNDSKEEVDYLVKKVKNLRIFADENNKMNCSLEDVKGELLIVSQFTLYADTQRSGNRPSFTEAAKPEMAKELYKYFVSQCKKEKIKVATGIFGENMQVSLINDGPVTIILEK